MVLPRCELAFRRTVFYLIIIFCYLLFGAAVFRILPNASTPRLDSEKQEKLDFERAELLNILWAESLGRSESQWSLLANQKLDSYERSLANAKDVDERPQPIKTFSDAFHHSFLLITTIGGIDTDDLSREAKIFSILYSFFGIPLSLLYLNQCVKAASSFWQDQNVFIFAGGCVFFVAVLYDVIEQSSDDTPFFDAIFSVFLAATTIGEEDGRVPRVLLYLIALIGISAFHTCYHSIQRTIEKNLQSFEISFSNLFAKVQRFLDNDENEKIDNNNRIPEEDEDAFVEETEGEEDFSAYST
uniref:Potassium channel domain-containing protein n=1 Tax=Panagrolaimus sp. PS1159 TaxID=55785 RepID=A0AC35GV12_9BILA